MTTLEALRDLPPFEVRVAGRTVAPSPPGGPVAHVEWAWGTKAEDGLYAEWQGSAGDEDVVVSTPRGRLELAPGRLRLFLAPSWEGRFTAAERAKAPAFAREWLDDHAGPLDVTAWALRPDRAYHARVGVESYWLPPRGPAGEPVEREALVLWVSDAPFRAGRAVRPLTPRGRSHRY